MEELLTVIRKRQSARTPFDTKRPIPNKHMRRILEAARWSPTAHNMQNFEVVVVEDMELLEAPAAIRAPVSEVFIRENYEQLSFSEEELRKKKAGILGTMFPPSWRTPGGKREKGSDAEGPGQAGLVQNSSALLVVLYDPARRAPASEGEVKRILRIPAHLRVAFSARLGYALSSPAYLRVRRDIEDFTHHNRYGNKELA